MMLEGHELDALYTLFDDPDETVQDAVRTRILSGGEAVITPLFSRVRAHNGLHREIVDALTADIRIECAVDRMLQMDAESYDYAELETGAWAVAKFGYPDLDVDAYRYKLDEMARAISVLAGPKADQQKRYLRLRNHVFLELGYSGDRRSYNNPDNSFLNKVMERRKGIPISLSVFTMILAGRIGLTLRGIGMPMHFLLAFESNMDELFIDPFNGGAIISAEDCRTLLTAAGVTLTADMLRPSTNRSIMQRMWRNLLAAYNESGRMEDVKYVNRVLAALSPEDEDDMEPPFLAEDNDIED